MKVEGRVFFLLLSSLCYLIVCYTIVMVKKQTRKALVESDSEYVLKLVLYIILGALWLKFESPVVLGMFQFNGFPLGLLVGLFFASHDKFQIDRKIEYAILILITILSYFLPVGIIF